MSDQAPPREWILTGEYVTIWNGEIAHRVIAVFPQLAIGEECKVIEYSAFTELNKLLHRIAEKCNRIQSELDLTQTDLREVLHGRTLGEAMEQTAKYDVFVEEWQQNTLNWKT